MAERVGPTDETHILHPSNDDDSLSPQSPKTNASCENNSCIYNPAATYVVQVPKDQIYRVPPPENAAIAERHRNDHPANTAAAAKARSARRACVARCCCAFLVAAPLLLLLLLAAGLLSTSLNPKLPIFSLDQLTQSGDGGAFKASLKSDNPNSRLDFSYRKQGGAVSLLLGKSEVATGRLPAFYHPHGSSELLEISLRRTSAAAKEIGKLAAAKAKSTKLRLTMNGLAARKEVWTWNLGSIKFDVACDVTVNSLTPKNSTTTHVLSQECRTTKRD